MRFRPEQHLCRQSDIRSVREQGRRVDCRAFTVWWKRREPAAAPASAPEIAPTAATSASPTGIASTTAAPATPTATVVPTGTAPATPKRARYAPAPVPARLSRVCVVASTAAVGHAVLRNRAKRRLREVFRQHQHLVPAGCDLMMIARAAATDRPMDELGKKFTEACGQIAAASPAPAA